MVVGDVIGADVDNDTIIVCSGITATVRTSFSSPGTFPTGLTFDYTQQNLISCDKTADSIYVHSGVTGTVTTSFSITGAATDPEGLAFDAVNLVAMTSYKSTIRLFSGITGTVTTSFSSAKAAGFTGHRGLTYDSLNGDVIEGNNDDDSIYVYSGITSTVKTSFSIPNPAIWFTALAYDNVNANLLSADQNSVYIHSGVTGTVTTSFSTPGARWEGLTYWRSPPGWTGKISGVTNPAAVMGIPWTSIATVKGVS